MLERLRQEQPLAKRILWKLAKTALKKIPVVGPNDFQKRIAPC